MDKIDRRRTYILVTDTETANTISKPDGGLDMSNVLVYDCGWQVIDKRGEVYAEASFVNRDIFVYERELMQSAYYAEKIPLYLRDIRLGSRILADTFEIRQAMINDIAMYNVKAIAAHNAHFDLTALNCTQRWVTKSAFRYWFPYGIPIWDTMRMAQDVILPKPSYQAFCRKHGLMAKGRPRKTAEALYKFISNNPGFVESHTGLEDVEIEARILTYCLRQRKKMRKELFAGAGLTPPPTEFQRAFSASLREIPVIRMG